MANFGRGGIRDVVDLTLFDTVSGLPVLYLESMKMASTEVGAETVYARGGRGNPRRIAWDSTKDVDVNGQDCLISPESLAILLGSSVSTGQQYVPVTQRITGITGTSITLAATPYTADLVNYPITVAPNTNNDGATIGTALTKVANSPTTGEYSITGLTITTGTTYSNQDFIITYYKQSTSGNKRITITSDTFPQTFKVTGYTLWRDEATGKDFPCRITIPKAKLLAPFKIEQAASGDPSVFDMKFTVLKDRTNQMVVYDLESDNPIN